MRFGQLNPYAALTDYGLFFIAGLFGGFVLIAFLRASRTPAARWIVFGAYLLATPFAMIAMVLGGLLSLVNVVVPSLAMGGIHGDRVFHWAAHLQACPLLNGSQPPRSASHHPSVPLTIQRSRGRPLCTRMFLAAEDGGESKFCQATLRVLRK